MNPGSLEFKNSAALPPARLLQPQQLFQPGAQAPRQPKHKGVGRHKAQMAHRKTAQGCRTPRPRDLNGRAWQHHAHHLHKLQKPQANKALHLAGRAQVLLNGRLVAAFHYRPQVRQHGHKAAVHQQRRQPQHCREQPRPDQIAFHASRPLLLKVHFKTGRVRRPAGRSARAKGPKPGPFQHVLF